MIRDPWLRALVILGVGIAAVYLFTLLWQVGARFADTILVFLMAYIVAFLLEPIVSRLLRWRPGMPRAAAVGIAFLGLLAALAVLGLLVVPPTVQQVADLADEIPEWGDRVPETIDRAQEWLDDRGIDVDLREFYEDEQVQARLQEFGESLAERTVALAQDLLFVLLYIVITLIVAFYLLLDWPNISRGVFSVTPPRYRTDLRYVFDSVDRTFGGYMRSWAILALIYAGGTAAVMALTGIPFILPVAVFAGVMLVIPFIGDIIAVIPPLVIGALTVDPGNVAVALIALVALQQVVLHVLRPRIMGTQVGLHPVLVLGAFLVGARAAGVWGAFFAVPVAGVVQALVSLIYHRYVGGNPGLMESPGLAPGSTLAAPDAATDPTPD